MGECTKLREILDAMLEWIQSLLIHKIENIPSNPKPSKSSSPKAANRSEK